VTTSESSYFKSSLHDGVEGFSESFELLAGENTSDIEVVSIYGYINLKDLLDEVLTSSTNNFTRDQE
jgi:hypothetical protein